MTDDSTSSSSGGNGHGNGNGNGDGGDIPYHLMPIAAICGMYALGATIRSLYQIYRNVTHDPSKLTPEMKLKGLGPKPLRSRQFAVLVASIVAAVLAYGYVTAIVDNSIAASDIFDPYDILQISTSAARDEIKQAYRSLSKAFHPDKGGDASTFHKINLAYRALSHEASRLNFQKYGHPDGPQTRTLSFAMPDWLLHPTGNVALVLVLLYLGAFAGLIVWVVRYMTRTEAAHAKRALESRVAGADAQYIATSLSPASTHLEVLFYIATTPENLAISQADIARADALRAERKAFLSKQNEDEKKAGGGLKELDLDDGGWADDEEEDEETKRKAELAKRAEEEKAKEAKRLAAATGKANSAENVKLEGIDDGVLGQQWVEDTLKKAGKWPPNLGSLAKATFADETGKAVTPMKNRAVRRNICMTMGRLNSTMLNTHPELLSAGAEGLIDPTYFKSTMEFRQRTGILLETALRVAMAARSYRLAKTVVETISMFKIGSMTHDDKQTLEWFKDTMIKQYGGEEGIPCLEFFSKDIETPDEDEIATGDTCALVMEIGRKHADNFTQQKLELCRKQGIPPQVAMQTYREGWWILIRCRKIGGGSSDAGDGDDIDTNNPLSQLFGAEAKKRFAAEKDENRLACAWPFIVSNVAQKKGKVKVQFKAPSTPGKYEFLVDVKSQEFLGSDQQFSVEKEVVNGEELARKLSEEDGDIDENGDNDEDVEETKKKK